MKVLVVDFWSDGNIGDAIMQCEILEQSTSVSKDVHILSCFGVNQFQLNAFNESLNFDYTTWHPAFFNTYIRLDNFTESHAKSRIWRLIKTFYSLNIANLKLKLYQFTKLNFFLGKNYKNLQRENFDAIVFNGRNYRNFSSKIKNYINNQPLLIHQKLLSAMFPSTPKLNAGFSAWELEPEVSKTISSIWKNYELNVARELYSQKFIESEFKLVCSYEKDLSFPYLSNKTYEGNKNKKKLAFSLTNVADNKKYMQQINLLLSNFRNKGYELILVDQVYLHHENVEDIIALIKEPYIRESSKKIDKLLDVYRSCDVVLSTRMHGSIMALSQGCRVASLAYDKGAKWSILTDEIPNYPIFSPGNSNVDDILSYLDSNQSFKDKLTFINSLKSNKREYVKEFLCNINP